MENLLKFALLCYVLCGDQVLAYPRLVRQISGRDLNQALLVNRLRRDAPSEASGSPSEGEGHVDHTVLQEQHQTDQTDQGANTDPSHEASPDIHAEQQPTDPAMDQPTDTHAEPGQDPTVETQPEPAANHPADTPVEPPTEPIQDQAQPSNPLVMSRPGEPMPIALPMRGNRAVHSEPNSATQGSGSGSSDPHAKQQHTPAETAPATGSHPGAGQHQAGGDGAGLAPQALPQTGNAPPPSGEPSMRGKQFWGQRQRPVALAQKKGPPKGQRPAPPRAGNQGVRKVSPGNQGRNQRPPPKWTGGGPGPATQAPGAGAGANPPSPGGTPWPNPYYDPYYSYMYGMPGPPPPPGGTGAPGQPPYPYPPYRMPEMPDMPDFPRPPGYNLNIQALQEGFPGGFPGGFPCMNMSDPRCIQQRMMGEMDIEGPYGEMDIESPYELDIEGPMAFQMLKQMGVHNITDSHFPEITLNNHVLEAMQRRFGVNTTAGIQRMSSNPEFQAFMYQILTHSTPLSLAEFNANLSRADVTRIMTNLDASPPNHRIAAVNLNQAHLSGALTPKDGASLTLDNNPMAGLFPNMPPNPYLGNPMMENPFMGNPFMGTPWGPPPAGTPPAGNTAGKTSPLVQKPAPTEVAQAGTFQALVAHGQGEREGRGRGEAREKGNKTAHHTGGGRGVHRQHAGHLLTTKPPTVAARTGFNTGRTNTSSMAMGVKSHPQTPHHVAAGSHQGQSHPIGPQGNTHPQHNHGSSHLGGPQANTQPQPQPPAVSQPVQPVPVIPKEKDIVGKDSNKGLSKDQRTRTGRKNKQVPAPAGTANNAQANANVGPAQTPVQPSGTRNVGAIPGQQNPGQTGPGVGTNPGQANTGVKASPGQQLGQGAKTNTIPIGIQEAGLAPEIMNKTVPITAETGYSTTGFAIAAATIIALVIILGPVGCMLCKMREKHAEKLRKQKAHKNRDMSENNIMESMVLHDFGKGSANSVTNSAAERSDYFSYGKGRFSTINSDMAEMEGLSGNPENPRGRLP